MQKCKLKMDLLIYNHSPVRSAASTARELCQRRHARPDAARRAQAPAAAAAARALARDRLGAARLRHGRGEQAPQHRAGEGGGGAGPGCAVHGGGSGEPAGGVAGALPGRRRFLGHRTVSEPLLLGQTGAHSQARWLALQSDPRCACSRGAGWIRTYGALRSGLTWCTAS